MTMIFVIVALVVLVLLLFILQGRRAKDEQKPVATRPTTPVSKAEFHAVSIRLRSNACEAAKSMEGKRFLSSAAPRLPLPDCDVLECRCKFVHHKDRRSQEDRRNSFAGGVASGATTGAQQVEQRQSDERRADPPETF